MYISQGSKTTLKFQMSHLEKCDNRENYATFLIFTSHITFFARCNRKFSLIPTLFHERYHSRESQKHEIRFFFRHNISAGGSRLPPAITLKWETFSSPRSQQRFFVIKPAALFRAFEGGQVPVLRSTRGGDSGPRPASGSS